MSSAIYPDPPRLVTAVCGHGEQQRLSNARLRLTFYNASVAYCGPARPGSAFQQSAVSGLLPRARARRGVRRRRPSTKKAHVGRNCTVSAADVGAWDGAVAVQQVLFPGHSLARARVGVFGAAGTAL